MLQVFASIDSFFLLQKPDIKKENVKEEPSEEEIDPLDQFMMEIDKSVKPKVRGKNFNFIFLL